MPVNIACGVCMSSALYNTADLEFLIASVYIPTCLMLPIAV